VTSEDSLVCLTLSFLRQRVKRNMYFSYLSSRMILDASENSVRIYLSPFSQSLLYPVRMHSVKIKLNLFHVQITMLLGHRDLKIK
jgi:hypothetical protein